MHVAATLDSGADSLFLGTHFANDAKPVSGERVLWLAVLARVWLDAFESSDAFLKQSEGKLSDPSVTRAQARRWLTLNFGDWVEDRETVCDLADIDPDVVRRAAKAKLAQVKADTKPTAQVIELDKAFSRLLDNEPSMSAEDLDSALEQLADMEAKAA